ncbi:hypothetical protein PpBr36_08551 [Pyricularia pennisetigena]|uniref:hypothetical protein n=1 Tax=Pyricularia pennisetigena TaxID=1578925 RepID=UPI00114D4F6E
MYAVITIDRERYWGIVSLPGHPLVGEIGYELSIISRERLDLSGGRRFPMIRTPSSSTGCQIPPSLTPVRPPPPQGLTCRCHCRELLTTCIRQNTEGSLD